MVILTRVHSSRGGCPQFVCPTVHDHIADDEIQLEAVQVTRPPIVDLKKYGITEDITHWTCERPSEEVRLGWNEYSKGEGRVEIFYFNRWGTVCNTTWDITDSNVVCRQLGFWRAFATVDSIVFGATPSGPVWLDKTNCSGEEDSLYRCRKAGVGGNQCQHETDAAVICDLTGQLLVGHTGGERRPLLYYNISAPSGFHERSAINVSAITMLYHKEETTLYWIQDVEGSSKNCELRRINVNGSNNQWETFATLTFCNRKSK
nr:scavenger receptor cysteine-rich domain-containing protein SCART1-like [Lytechinus pictus]